MSAQGRSPDAALDAGATSARAIVIGASAGGIDALSVLLPALRASVPAVVLVVVHLPAEPPSLLVDIFGPRCALPVCEARDKDSAMPGTLVFAPPDYHLLVERGGQLALSADAPLHHSRPSIDVLFESAADAYGAALLGIVLTGASVDGAAGLAAVRRVGGQAWVQCPDTAAASAMPRFALARVPDAQVLSLQAMAQRLAALGAALADEPGPGAAAHAAPTARPKASP